MFPRGRDKLITLPLRFGFGFGSRSLPFRSVGPRRFNSPPPPPPRTTQQQSISSPNANAPWPNCRDEVKQTPLANLLRLATSTTTHRANSGQISLGEEIIANSAVHLQCPSSSAPGGLCHVYLVGTCHVSQESCDEVKAVISYLKPQAVFLELCHERVHALTRQNVENKNVSPSSGSWFRAKTDNAVEGEEFRFAYEEARSYGARVYLGDRPWHITLSRTSKGLTMRRMIKMLYDLLFKSDISKLAWEISKKTEGLEDGLELMKKVMDHEDGRTFMSQGMNKVFPAFEEAFVAERDKYMAQALWRVARKHSSVVAVVGKDHLSGIKRSWMQPVEVQSLLEVPSGKDATWISKMFAGPEPIEGMEENDLVNLEEIGVEVVELQDIN